MQRSSFESIIASTQTDPNQRISVLKSDKGEKEFELRFESFGENVGWFLQNSIPLTQLELSGLRGMLGCSLQSHCKSVDSHSSESADSEPLILKFPAGRKETRQSIASIS